MANPALDSKRSTRASESSRSSAILTGASAAGGGKKLIGTVPGALSLRPGRGGSRLGPSTMRNLSAVTGAKLTVVGTSASGKSATLRQPAPSLASSTGVKPAGANGDTSPGTKIVADWIVCAAG